MSSKMVFANQWKWKKKTKNESEYNMKLNVCTLTWHFLMTLMKNIKCKTCEMNFVRID